MPGDAESVAEVPTLALHDTSRVSESDVLLCRFKMALMEFVKDDVSLQSPTMDIHRALAAFMNDVMHHDFSRQCEFLARLEGAPKRL